MASFEDLSDDILYLILGYLGSERSLTLDQLRLVSKRFVVFAESVLYRSIVLEEDNDAQEQASYRFIERILDPSDALRQYVRCLAVKSFRGDDASSCMNSNLLLQCMQCIAKLESFSWNAEVPVPASLLKALEKCHPCAQLCISLRRLDDPAILSTQLHRLSVNIPCSDIVHPDSTAAFESLRSVLVQCNGLRAFCLNVHQEAKLLRVDGWTPDKDPHTDQDIRHTTPAYDPFPIHAAIVTASMESASSDTLNKVQIPLRNTDHLPPLTELCLGARTYNLDHTHSVNLLRCMDWTRLKKLTLRPSNPTSFFRTFTAMLPLLDTLDISFHSERQSYYLYTRQASLEECSEFIATLYSLKALVIRCDVVEPSNVFWHNLVSDQGKRLQSLSLRARNDRLDGPDYPIGPAQMLSCFTTLTTLELAVHASQFLCNHWQECEEPWHTETCTYTRNLPLIPSLKHLQLSFKTHSGDTGALHSYVLDSAHHITRALWSSYSTFSANDNFELETVCLRFWRWEAPSAHYDDRETLPNAYITEVVFDSRRVGGHLVVKARNSQRTIITRYKETWVCRADSDSSDSESGKVRAHYITESRDDTGQPVVSSRRFSGLLEKTLCFSC